ncbi:MAG: class I SAM-dependent methyltransferase [Acidobacteriia bacterium]|jgi:SAM-dependent methyltransferase|nr:class I SAM-dependent methyltransferase [Terriglobia bacterium]
MPRLPRKTSLYQYARMNPIESEKLRINQIIAKALRPERVLDAFAGDGTSTRIFAKYAKLIVAIDKNREAVETLLTLRRTRKLAVAYCDNLSLMPSLSARSFDLIDLDPCGNCYSQLEHARRLRSPEGLLLISSGQIQRVVRGLDIPELPTSRLYSGRRSVFWAEQIWIPFLLKSLRRGNDLDLIHFFTSPVLTRVVLGPTNVRQSLSRLQTRSRYLGWFEEAAKAAQSTS